MRVQQSHEKPSSSTDHALQVSIVAAEGELLKISNTTFPIPLETLESSLYSKRNEN
jgi:hypothetical protein